MLLYQLCLGLRVLLYANISEYLPTSESVGFRITVHDKWHVPFPDAFGYSAPTGFLTSFGVRMVSGLLAIAIAHELLLNYANHARLTDELPKPCHIFRSSSTASPRHTAVVRKAAKTRPTTSTTISTIPSRLEFADGVAFVLPIQQHVNILRASYEQFSLYPFYQLYLKSAYSHGRTLGYPSLITIILSYTRARINENNPLPHFSTL